MKSNETNTKYFATGQVTLVPFVTNYIALTVE